MEEENDHKIFEMLDAFYKHPANRKLIEKYKEKTYFDLIGKGTSETVHSKFLQTIFSYNWSVTPHYKPVVTLLRAILSRACKSGKLSEFPEKLSSLIFSKPEAINVREVTTEYCCDGVIYKKGGKRKGYADIVIDCLVDHNDSEGDLKPLKIVIENKIASSEHDSQTWRYYAFFHELTDEEAAEHNIKYDRKCPRYRQPGEDQIFVMLTPHSNTELENATGKDTFCECHHYIHINYQDILDYVLTPLVEQKHVEQHIGNLLEEYITTLGRPNDKTDHIMALSPQDKAILKEFWEANQEIFTAAIDALAESDADQEVAKEARAIHNSLISLRKSQKKYDLYLDDNLLAKAQGMADVFKEAVKSIMENNEVTAEDLRIKIEKAFKLQSCSLSNSIINDEYYIEKRNSSQEGPVKFAKRFRDFTIKDSTFHTTTMWTAEQFGIFKDFLITKYPQYKIIP